MGKDHTDRPRTRHSGKVIGHFVKFSPAFEKKLRKNTTVSRPPMMEAFIHVLVDERSIRVVPCDSASIEITGPEPTDEDRVVVYNTLVDKHPLNNMCQFTEELKSGKGKNKYKEYTLVE